MSKSIIGFGLAIVGIALIATGIGAPLGTIALGAGLGSISVASVIGVGLLVASSVLIGPAVPKMPGSLSDGGRSRLSASLDPVAPRKIVFGETAMATDVRYQAFTGANQEYLEQIVAVASHEVQSIDEIWLDNEKAWSAAGGVAAKFAGFLTVATRNPGAPANGIAIDAVWTASCTLTGCAYVHLEYLLVRDDGNGGNDSPFASGVTSRMTIRGKGAKTYDPRLDGTVAGGAGAQRADDQSTWAWSAGASRTPALQLLFYELGWKINGKLAIGKGVPKARLDLASYAVAANACDESVTRSAANGGGTEPRYRSDGVLSEADNPAAVREALCVTMNAVLRDAGGHLSLTVLQDDLASPAASFDENDVVGAIDWRQTPDLQAIFNIVRGQRTDPSDNALYQPVDYPEVELASTDGIDRIATLNLPMVQSNGQAQRLAKQFLQRNQYQGRLSLTGKPSWWQLSLGEVFQFSHSTFGWANKKFRCAGIRISRSGETEIVAVEEHADIYAWVNNEAAAVSAPAPTVYDAAANHPLQSRINRAADRISRLGDDNRLSRVEKRRVIREYGDLIAEQPDISAKADVYGITTEKANYTAAVSALTAYLGTLAVPVAWNDTSDYTAVVAAAWKSSWSDLYAKRQLLLNKMDDLAGRRTRLIGTDGRLSDGRAQPSNRNYGLRSTYSGLTLTGLDNVTSAKVAISSSAWNSDWGTTITFPAADIFGLAFSTKYYIWRNQPDPETAGSSYGASTNLDDALGTGKAYMGYCITPASGGAATGGSGPGTGDCVHPDAWVEMAGGRPRRAREVAAGDRIVVLNATRDGTRAEEVESSHSGENDRVRIVMESGIAVTLSIDTPLTLRGRGFAIAANAAGRELPVKDERGFRWERCVAVLDAGFGEVAHIRCRQATYAAGDIAGRSILTHNPKP